MNSMTRLTRALLAAAVVSSLTTSSYALTPDEKVKVRELVREGGDLVQNAQYTEARDRFMAALVLAPVPAIALYAGRAYESLRDPTRAAQLYRLALDMPLDPLLWDNDKTKTDVQLRAREQARVALKELLGHNCTLRIQIVGAADEEIQASVDEVALEEHSLREDQPVNPGSHVVAIVHQGQRHSQTIALNHEDHKTVTFDVHAANQTVSPAALTPTPSVAPRVAPFVAVPNKSSRSDVVAQPPADAGGGNAHVYAMWTAYGVGALGLGTGVVAGVLALNRRSSLIQEGCSDSGSCPSDGAVDASSVNGYNRLRTITTVALVVGGVSTLGGLALTLTMPKAQHAAQVTLLLQPGSVMARAAF
jgi:hypothetical protein